MMIDMHRAKSIAAGCIAAWALVACGGGGGNDTNGASGGNVAGNPPAGFSGQDASAPVLTNNIATDGFNWINYRRTQAGVPALTRNSLIDRAAQAHSDYQRINNTVTHTETAGKSGFFGASVENRLNAAGYNLVPDYAAGEIISATSNGSGFYMAEELVTAIYHRFVMFEPVFRDMGTGSATGSGNYTYFTANFGATRGYGAGLPARTVVTWPFNGQTGVTPNFASDYEEPDPVPGTNEVGYPISVHTNLTEPLTVQSFTVRPRNGSNLLTRMLVRGQDANTTSSSVAAIVPLAPLAPQTTYDVSFNGTVSGVPVTRTWSFTTR